MLQESSFCRNSKKKLSNPEGILNGSFDSGNNRGEFAKDSYWTHKRTSRKNITSEIITGNFREIIIHGKVSVIILNQAQQWSHFLEGVPV